MSKVYLRCNHPESHRFGTITQLDNEKWDYSLSHIISLRDNLKALGLELITQDNQSEVVLEIHENAHVDRTYPDVPLIGYAVESEYFHPINYNTEVLSAYDRFFHFDCEFLERHSTLWKTTEPRHLSQRYFDFQSPSWENRPTFLTNISRNKNYKKKCVNNGYEERYKVLTYFMNRYQDSDKYNVVLCGDGWGLPKKRNGLVGHYTHRILEELKFDQLGIFSGNGSLRRIWAGPTDKKMSMLSKSKFTLAIENVYYRRGYVTEKLFDAMRCGSIPVTKGKPITTFQIPQELYIDIDDFSGLEELAKFIENYGENDYKCWRTVRETFIESYGFQSGTSDYWAKNLLTGLLSAETLSK